MHGRLGNKMIGYALLTALKLEYGFRVFMDSKDLKKLSFYFKNIDQVESLGAQSFTSLMADLY